jgi:hypothetical protein
VHRRRAPCQLGLQPMTRTLRMLPLGAG